tara:strand:- start:75 stop:713 length:639 start_codon:yes stop_codon:yes gene_type:complete
MAWRNKDSNTNENKFNKFFKKNNDTKFNNKIYDRNFDNDKPKDQKLNENVSYHNGYDPTNENKKFTRNNYRSNFKSNRNDSFKKYNKTNIQPKVDKKFIINTYTEEILNIEKQLSSDKYISKIKKNELEAKLKELKNKKENEFPLLNENKKDIISEPKVTCWNKISNSKIFNEKKEEKKPKKIYEEHIESDYEGEDFIDDDDSLIDEDYYNN